MSVLRTLLERAGLGLATLICLGGSQALAGPDREPGVGLPRDISHHGHLIDGGLHFGNVAVVLLFIMVVAWLAITWFKHDENHKAKYDHGNTKRAAWMVAGFTMVIFLVVDGHHFYASVVDLDEVFWNWDAADQPNSVKVEVNARQWAWQFRYAGDDGTFATADDIVTFNELHVPVDRPIYIQLRAVDVIHSLYIPHVRVKTDAVPGMTNKLWFQVDSEKLKASGPNNEFEIACAQHCGTWHYKMKGIMRVHRTDAEFNAWLQEAATNSKLDYTEEASQEDIGKGIALEPKFGPHWGWTWEQS